MAAAMSWSTLKERLLAAVLLLVSVALALALVRPPSPLASAERLLEAIAFRLFAPGRAPSERVAIIGITEETLSRFPYRSPIDRAFLARLLDDLADSAPAAIGIDILFDQPTEPDKDASLRDALRRAADRVVLISATPATPLPSAQRRYLDGFTSGLTTGFANLARDRFDDTIRRHLPIDPESGARSFAAALAEAAGGRAPREPFDIEWRRRQDAPFPTYPAETVALLPKEWLRGKVVLIGSLLPGADEHRTLASAFGKPSFGVEIHASVVSQILEGRENFASGRSRVELWSTIGLGAIGTGAGLILVGWSLVGTLGALALLSWAGALGLYAATGVLPPLIPPVLAMGLASGSARIWRGRGERRDRQVLRQLFSRFVSEPVVAEVLREREAFLRGGRPRPHELTATVLFSDIAGFTPICESLPPEPLIAWLDRYIDTMVQCITDHGGVVLRFIGDGILAVFGAPIARTTEDGITEDARAAVRCAGAMEIAMRELNAFWREVGLPVAGIRVGIHTGPLVAGSLGNGPHMEYCLLGDTANTAARLEALGKQHAGGGAEDCVILLGESTWRRLDGSVSGIAVGEVALKGKRQRIGVYRVDSAAAATAPPLPVHHSVPG
jgi:class 3 adenylate cyclase